MVVSSRGLSLVKLKEIINEIYASKVTYDQKCIEGKLPLENMDQYVVTFLSLQYGLKSIVSGKLSFISFLTGSKYLRFSDWAKAIYKAVEKYAPEDHDVAVFKKIISNDIDEKYKEKADEVKDKSVRTLKFCLKEQYPTKSEPDIQELVSSKCSGYLEVRFNTT
jgi:hypothetical protein